MDDKEILKQFENNLKAIEKDVLEASDTADEVYETVISQLQIDHSDSDFVQEIMDLLRGQTKDFLVYSIWNHMTEEQSKVLQTYLKEVFSGFPAEDHDDILLEFAQGYPDLMDKVLDGLSDFFKDFIERFNRYYKA